ncbi:MAG: CDP-glycerol glycerophosphotransferase family protein [Oscillospiraceae bacterium]|nr:CDP-glycerol glycerophosphotransferase family protein [Oscillospiraceae bacterium]
MDRIRKRIKKFMQNSKIFYGLYKWIVNTKRTYYFNKYKKRYPIEEKTILFESFQGRIYACSPKAMYLAALNDERFSDYNFIWAVRDLKKYAFLKENRNTKVVKYRTNEYMRALARAKYWVTNSTMLPHVIPSKDHVFIQSWHGTPLKRLGCDIKNQGNNAQKLSEIHKQYTTQGKRITYFLSPSEFYTDKIGSAYAQGKEKFVECGYPRNDFLFSHTLEDVKRIKESLGIPKDKKVLLYAPTFRDNTFERGKGFHYDIGIDFDMLKRELSDDYVVLFRAHYFIIDKFDMEKYEGFVYNVSKYDDINELYIISDMLLTDYSSVFFDFANLRRPIMFFMYDYEEYKNNLRDFYLEMNELPGPIVYKNEELCKMIRAAEKDFCCDEKYQKFNARFNTYNDANSSNRALGECILNA